MNDAYTVIVADVGCGYCGEGESYTVQGPDEVWMTEKLLGDEGKDEAKSRAYDLNTAYNLGRRVGQQVPKLFTEQPPQGDVRILVWSADLKLWTNAWWYQGKEVDEHFLKLKYTHWIPEPPPPLGTTTTETAPAEPIPTIPATAPPTSTPTPAVDKHDDDIPF